jgi:serine/threonine protein kinase
LHREIPPNSYEIIERIGEGTEAVVHKVRWNGKLCALKKFKGIPCHDDFIREISIMSLVNHPNLVRCYGGQTKNDNYAILSELMEDNLFNLLSKKSIKLDPYHVYKMAIQVCRGMEYLHACNLIHRDLKSVNLLVDTDLNVKVCDFGLSRLIDRERNMTGNVGTVSWIAPEIFQQEHYTEKADVYSFGVVLWELWTRRIPFEDESTFEIPLSVIRGHRPVIPDNCPKDFAKLMKTCWSGKQAKRPSFTKVESSLNKLLKSIPESPINSIFKVKPGRSNSDGIKISPKSKRSSQRMEQSEDDKRSPSGSGSGSSRKRSGTTQININSNSTSSSKEEREKKIKVKL